jgi:hypothetical protein
LNGTPAKSLFQFVQVGVEKGPGITNDDERFRFHAAAGFGPEIARVVKSGAVA